MSKHLQELADRIGSLLDRLASGQNLSSDDLEILHEDVATKANGLPREGILEAFDLAIDGNHSRREVGFYVLTEWIDEPAVVERIGMCLSDSDPNWRHWSIQAVATNCLTQFGLKLADIIENDPDEMCRSSAIWAGARMQSAECLPVILRLAAKCTPEDFRFVSALSTYATEDCRPILQKWFNDPSQGKSTRIESAWGLGKLGDSTAIDYLEEMLNDPRRAYGQEYSDGNRTWVATVFDPGESWRAARALCEIYSWSFAQDADLVAETKKRVREMRLNDNRKSAYRYLLYVAMLEVRPIENITDQWWRCWNPLFWRRELRRLRFLGSLADWLHNLAYYSSLDFEDFEEHHFWRDFEDLKSRFSDFQPARYRDAFERRFAELENDAASENHRSPS